MRHQISLPPTIWVIDNLCTAGLAACWKKSRDQSFPRQHRITWGAHHLGTSMLCLWGCGSRGYISLILSVHQRVCTYLCNTSQECHECWKLLIKVGRKVGGSTSEPSSTFPNSLPTIKPPSSPPPPPPPRYIQTNAWNNYERWWFQNERRLKLYFFNGWMDG